MCACTRMEYRWVPLLPRSSPRRTISCVVPTIYRERACTHTAVNSISGPWFEALVRRREQLARYKGRNAVANGTAAVSNRHGEVPMAATRLATRPADVGPNRRCKAPGATEPSPCVGSLSHATRPGALHKPQAPEAPSAPLPGRHDTMPSGSGSSPASLAVRPLVLPICAHVSSTHRLGSRLPCAFAHDYTGAHPWGGRTACIGCPFPQLHCSIRMGDPHCPPIFSSFCNRIFTH